MIGQFNMNDYLAEMQYKMYEANAPEEDKEEKEDKDEESDDKKDEVKKDKAPAKVGNKATDTAKGTNKPATSNIAKSSPPKEIGNVPASSPKVKDGGVTNPEEGLIIPKENKPFYDWLKKEYQKGATEVKVEYKLGTNKFEPGYQMEDKSTKDFKPGMFSNSKSETKAPAQKPAAKTEAKPVEKSNAKPVAKAEPKKEETKKEDKTQEQFKKKEKE